MPLKIQIGVVVYTKIGTNTSILSSEFKFFNEFKERNKNCEFIFIAISEFTKKSILNNRSLLDFSPSIITVKDQKDLHKLNGLSGVFSYMLRNTFFGGGVDKACITNYMINAYCTRDLNIPLFIRTPDSEYPYFDYKNMIDVRIGKPTPSQPKFVEINREEIAKIPNLINYDNVYFVANGSRKICDWVVDIAFNDIPEYNRVIDLKGISERTLYVSDAILFNVWQEYSEYSYLTKEATIDRLIFIGYLGGSVAKGRLKALPKIFGPINKEIPTDIVGPGASELNIDRTDVNLIDRGIYKKEFYETLNSHLAYIFVGKGNSTNKYINKTVYDCISARCPVVVFTECDTTGIIFDNREFYFSNEDELKNIYEKLKNPKIREEWIDKQYAEIKNKLDTLMDPMFSFSDFCKPKEMITTEIRLQPLF